jgi:ribonuclease-3
MWRCPTASGSAAPTPRSPSDAGAPESSRHPGGPLPSEPERDGGTGTVAALARRLGLPGVSELLLQALTHPSYAHEHPPTPHNETLAFLGDAVLGLVVAELLVQHDPAAGPGALTVRRAATVSTRGLAAWARELGVDACLRLGRGEEQHAGRDKESVLATALEAVLAVVYLARGPAAVVPLVRRVMRLDEPSASGA